MTRGAHALDQRHTLRRGLQMVRHRGDERGHRRAREAGACGDAIGEHLRLDATEVEVAPVARAPMLEHLGERGLRIGLRKVLAHQFQRLPAHDHAADIEHDGTARRHDGVRRRCSSAAVEASSPLASPDAKRGSSWLANALPSSTPH